MSLYAVDALDDALEAARAFLFPFEPGRWLRLSVVVFFVGGGGTGLNSGQFDVPSGGGDGVVEGVPSPGVDIETALLIAAVAAVALLVVALFLLVGSVMEFVLIESLRREEVAVRRYWGRRWRQGVRLFAFRTVLGVVTLGTVAAGAALAVLPFLAGDAGISILAVLVVVPAVALLSILAGLVNGFTRAFVVPIMTMEDCGVLAGWRRLLGSVREAPKQYLAYAVLGFVLGIAASIVLALGGAVAVLLLLIPFGILGLAAWGLFLAAEFAGLIAGGLVVVAFALAALLALALVQVPIVVYLRYYALFVLGDVDPDLDLVPERRSAVRE